MSFGLNLALNFGLARFIDAAAGLLLDTYPATAAYSVRQLKTNATNAVRVRRDSDNTEQDIGFVDGELDTTSLESFVNGYNDTLPLDTASATAAYSLRNLSSSYTGNVVRVRRDSDNAEQDFTATEITDGTLATWAGANNGLVTTWYDQSGNGKDASQATQANQPKIYDASTGLILENGKPAVEFDGAGDDLRASLGSANYDNFSAFCVNNPSASVIGFEVIWGLVHTSSTVNYYLRRNSTTDNSQSITLTPTVTVNSTNTPFSAQNLQSVVIDRSVASNNAWSNGVLSTATGTTDSIGTQDYFIDIGGANVSMSGNIQELIFYDTDQSSNRTAIEGNINQHYGIYSSNGFVTTWYDQSSNANDATQATQADQPKIYDSVTGLILENGQPALSFDGVDDYLSHIMDASLASSFTDISMFGAWRHGAVATNTLAQIGSVNNRGGLVFTESVYEKARNTALYEARAARVDDTQILSSSFHLSTPSASIYINGNGGTQSGTPVYNTPVANDRIWIGSFNGAGGLLNGTIQELIIYNTDQTANRTAIETDMNSYYTIY